MTFNTKFNMCQQVFAIDDGKIKTYAVREIKIDIKASRINVVYGLEGYARNNSKDSIGTERKTATDADLYMLEAEAIEALKEKGTK